MLFKLTCVALALLGGFSSEGAILENQSCEGASDGTLFADSTDCSHYYICLNEKAELLVCPKTLKYNPTTNKCDAAANLPKTASCMTNAVNEGTEFQAADQTEVKDSICRDSSTYYLLPYEGDCTRYILCYYGQSSVEYCSANLYFNAAASKCDSQSNVPPSDPCFGNAYSTTPDYYTTVGTGICAGQPDGTYLPDQEICSRYYICVGGSAVSEYCPGGLYFNPLTGRCGAFSDLPSWTPCLSTPAPPTVSSTSPDPDTTTDAYDPRCSQYPDGSYLPHPLFCEIYYICLSNQALSYTCPGDLVFNPAELRCDFPSTLPSWTPCLSNPSNKCKVEDDGTYLPDPDDCQSYYVCLGGDASRYDCPPGLYYNPISSLCVRQDNLPPDVPCSYTTRGPTTPDDTTYGTETTWWADSTWYAQKN